MGDDCNRLNNCHYTKGSCQWSKSTDPRAYCKCETPYSTESNCSEVLKSKRYRYPKGSGTIHTDCVPHPIQLQPDGNCDTYFGKSWTKKNEERCGYSNAGVRSLCFVDYACQPKTQNDDCCFDTLPGQSDLEDAKAEVDT